MFVNFISFMYEIYLMRIIKKINVQFVCKKFFFLSVWEKIVNEIIAVSDDFERIVSIIVQTTFWPFLPSFPWKENFILENDILGQMMNLAGFYVDGKWVLKNLRKLL